MSFRLNERSCGILLHVTSLPGPYGSGDLGQPARRFARSLAIAGQRWWQMLPIGPIGFGNAPYSGGSALAGNPLLIDLNQLVTQGLLTQEDLEPLPRNHPADKVCYGTMRRYRTARLRIAFDRFQRRRRPPASIDRFYEENGHWLDDDALYAALKRAHHGASWTQWDHPTRQRVPSALREARRALRHDVKYEQFVQYVFARQWTALKHSCNRRGIGLIGDIPLFVGHDSCDIWAHRDLFQLDSHGRPKRVSGVPPDAFSATGQLWGHPLYRWSRHRATGFSWWVKRFALAAQRFDACRVDHFLGLHRCWSVSGTAKTAAHGRWIASPGDELLRAVHQTVGPLPLIAEDLGLVTTASKQMLRRWKLPGMRVLQYGFAAGDRTHRPVHYPRRCVAVTGTHDNDTVVGWFQKLPPDQRRRVLRATGTDGKEIHWDFIKMLYRSKADVVILPMQDVLGLDNDARMNCPGTNKGNWRWRLSPGAFTTAVARRLNNEARAAGRAF